ncbi:MAG: DUF262 domain-containing protein [Polyangiaceae bacterium]|nr:DUF262 domain-containing protein [Polyangiaceae bacterium]
MLATKSTLFSDPSVQFLQRLLEDFARGEIALPRFQRPFVWDREHRLELFDSVKKGIPIGSLMILEMRSSLDKEVEVLPKTELGPFLLPTVPEGVPKRYLLDGEQRLMTLYFALYPSQVLPGETQGEPASAFEVFYDLEGKRFLTREELRGEEPPLHYFPLREIFVPRGVLKFQRDLVGKLEKNLVGKLEQTNEQRAILEKQIADYLERSDSVSEAIRQYKIPVTVLSANDLSLAAETFKRVNSQGVSMSEVHMMNAVTWRPSFDLIDSFDELRAQMLGHFFWQDRENLDDQVLLRVAKRLIDRDVYDEDVSGIAPKIREKNVLERVGSAMLRCARFLRSRGLHNPAHIPNMIQLVVLGRVFDDQPEPTAEALDRLEDWLWFTSYAEVLSPFIRTSYLTLERQATAIAAGRQPEPFSRNVQRKNLPRFDFRGSRSRALAWCLANRMADHGHPETPMLLAELGGRAMARINLPKKANSAEPAALRVLLHPDEIDAFRQDLNSGQVRDTKLIKAQLLSHQAVRAFSKGDNGIQKFTEIRERDLNQMEEKKFAAAGKRLFPGAFP